MAFVRSANTLASRSLTAMNGLKTNVRSMGSLAKMDYLDPLEINSLLTEEERMIRVCIFY